MRGLSDPATEEASQDLNYKEETWQDQVQHADENLSASCAPGSSTYAGNPGDSGYVVTS